jgi:hypothetical protein
MTVGNVDQNGGTHMQSKSIKLLLLSTLILCVGLAMSPVSAGIQNSGYGVPVLHNELHKIRPTMLAGNPAVCKANYDQCIRGCDGFAQCNRQCAINYNGCLR